MSRTYINFPLHLHNTNLKYMDMDTKSGVPWHCPPVVNNIFKNLCARDLSTCAKVCSLWNSMSITENNRRRFVEWFLEINIGQSVDNKGRIIEVAPLAGTLYPFQNQLACMRARPGFCLAFVTTETLEHIADDPPSPPAARKRLKKDIHERIKKRIENLRYNFLRPLLPTQCQIHCITSPGVIGCHDNGSPVEVEEGRVISGFLIPEFPGVHIQHCLLDDIKGWKKRKLPDRPIKAMLLFGNKPSSRLVSEYIHKCIVHNAQEEFAVGGAIVESVLDGFGMCFLFSGENLQAASVVIDQSTEDVAVELALFKKTGMLEDHCFAFMFSCVDKGINKYSVPNFECSIFRNMYPDVPLAGVFGNGEIGNHFLPNVDKEDPDHMQRCKKFSSKNCLRAYNTIFVLFSVKIL